MEDDREATEQCLDLGIGGAIPTGKTLVPG
jgi:hypothetical protein